jgi:hypothetical protein
MSTKITISHDVDDKLKYHLYQQCYENRNVWIQLDDAKEFEVWRDGNETRIRLAIPVEVWRHAVNGWNSSHWAQHPERDNADPDI